MNATVQTMTVNQEMSQNRVFSVGIAKTKDEKMAVYRLRYSIYVEEMSRKLKSADSERKLLYDEMDEWALLLYVKADSELIATGRLNIGPVHAYPQEIVDVLQMERFCNFPASHGEQNFGLITKLMVSPLYRNSPALYLLMAKAYELSCEHRVQFTFGGCNLYLLRLYEEIGVRRYGRNFQDPGYGLLAPIVWIIDDVEHMRRVHSPFYRIARKRQDVNKKAADWFFAEFPTAAAVINSQLVTEEELWSFLCSRLGSSPENNIALLQGLSAAEAAKFLHTCSVVAQCQTGDQLITAGDPCSDMNILLAGEVTVRSDAGLKKAAPGQHFGTIGLVEPACQLYDATASTDSEILVLSRMAFTKFRHRHPEAGNLILNNLNNLQAAEHRRDK